eukprot:748929-Hanusia_phi.AAC.1
MEEVRGAVMLKDLLLYYADVVAGYQLNDEVPPPSPPPPCRCRCWCWCSLLLLLLVSVSLTRASGARRVTASHVGIQLVMK